MSDHSYAMSVKDTVAIVPAAQGSLNTAWVTPFSGAGAANRAVYKIFVGTISSGTISMALYQATDGGGTGRKAIVGAAITDFTTATDERMRSVEISPGALDADDGFIYVRAEVIVSTGTPVWMVELVKHWLRNPGLGGQDSTYDQAVECFSQNA